MVSACLVLPPAWLDFDYAVPVVVTAIALFSFTPSPFLPSSPLFLCSLTAAHRFGRIFHFGIFGPIIRGRRDGPRPPSTLRRRLPGSWPAAWTHGGVELNCELNMYHGFPFVESGYKVNDGPGYPRVKGMCKNVDGSRFPSW